MPLVETTSSILELPSSSKQDDDFFFLLKIFGEDWEDDESIENGVEQAVAPKIQPVEPHIARLG